MLTPGIHANFETGVRALANHAAVKTAARGPVGEGANCGQAALFTAEASLFVTDPALSHEVFGASSVIVRAKDLGEIAAIVEGLEGQLTATLLFDESDEASVASLIPLLARKVGRILGNGWPTGVEVCHAMVHGGPFPATTDSRVTSVGALAIERFLRPVCYQNLPDRLLPAALRESNPYKVARRVGGVMQTITAELPRARQEQK
jgi:NADP-dependent aldehyde dehydrogenase